MLTRGSTRGGSGGRGGGRGRGGLGSGTPRAFGASERTGGGDLPLGDLTVELNAANILPSKNTAQISGFRCIASYNWLDKSKPTIIVPGSPALWSPPANCRKLEPDKGEVFIDQNGARYGSFPLEPMFRAIYEVDPQMDLDDIDVVICRNSMAKLFDFVTVSSKNFEIDVEMIGDKAVFIRKEKKTTEIVEGFRGFGNTFPDEYTTWDNGVKGSSSHHRVAEYMFGGLKYLVRFESDCYLAGKTEGGKGPPPPSQGGKAGLDDTMALLGSDDGMRISEKRPDPDTGHGLDLRKGGRDIDQLAMAEIKTRAAHRVLDMDSVLPRLWISQTPNLIAAYHKGGRFHDVRILDVRKDIRNWEAQNSVNLQKLHTLIQRIIETVENTVSMKCRIRGTESGKLEVWELDISHPSALPNDLRFKLREDMGLADEGDDWNVHGRDYDDSEFDRDYEPEDDESDKDFTACSAEDCGYCGHCGY